MKRWILKSIICLIISLVLFLDCCKEADLPTLNTADVYDIKTRSAAAGGYITEDGGGVIHSRGICWGIKDNPTIYDSKRYCGKGDGSFGCNISGLTPDTHYHLRAFATNGTGTAYGNEVHFTTLPIVINAVTISVDARWASIARAYGNIECNDEVNLLGKGFCIGTTENPTDKDQIFECTIGTGDYNRCLSGLEPGTVYHVRAYASTPLGIEYGEDICFNTLGFPSVVTSVAEITKTSAKAEARIVWSEYAYKGPFGDQGFEYGATDDPPITGFCVSDLGGRVLIGEDGKFSCIIPDLTAGTTYYLRSYFYIFESNLIPEDRCTSEIKIFGNEVIFRTNQ